MACVMEKPREGVMRAYLLAGAFLVLLSLWPGNAPAQSEALDKADRQGQALYQAGRYGEAIPFYEKALQLSEREFGPEHPKVATSLNNLALLYDAQGRYGDAEPLYKRSLAIREKALGPDHPNVATSLTNLAELYRAQGRYADAEPLYKRALAINEKALGPEHPDVATSLNNLALLYQAQGRYGDAEPLYKRALAILEKALGPDHPNVATSLNNLAELYRAQGSYADAEPLYKRALAIDEKTLGPEHPDVATDLNNLAALYQAQGRYGDAEPLYKRSLAILEKTLGPEHPDVGQSLTNLAELYRAQGRYGDAEPLHKRSLAIREKALGPQHPDVGESLNNLALLYQAQGRYADAEPLYKRALAINEKALGPEHPDVAQSLNNLALLYQAQGRYADAEPLHKCALAIWEKALGPDHPHVAASLTNLAELYRAQGRHADAEPLHKRSLAIHEKALGPEHPDVANSLNNLASLYHAQGRHADAEPLQKRALAIYEKALGPEHPLVATGLNNLAVLYRAQGRHADAEPLHKRALAIDEKALGPEHPSVAIDLNNLAELYRAQGRHADAEPLYKRALAILEKALGPDHPNVATSLTNLAELYRAQGSYADAEPLYKRALAIKKKALGPEHPSVATGLENYAALLEKTGRGAETAKMKARAKTIRAKRAGGNPLISPVFAASEPGQDAPADAGLGATIEKLLPVGKNGHLDAVRKAFDRGDTDAALDDLRPLAEKGDTKAQILLGDLFFTGKGVPHNYSMAWQWYQRAAHAGNAQAQFKLANMYRKGLGVPYYLSKAVEWYGRAAEQDHVEAQYMLGLIHSGRFGGAFVNRGKAETWLGMAAEQGSQEAALALEGIYAGGFLPRRRDDQDVDTAQGEPDDEAARIRRAIVEALDTLAARLGDMTMRDRMRVGKNIDGSFSVVIPPLGFRQADGARIFVESTKINVKPQGGGPKEDSQAYRVAVTLPARIRIKFTGDGPMYTVTYNQKRFTGLWLPALQAFVEADIKVKDLVMGEPGQSLTIGVNRLENHIDLKEGAPGVWSGPSSLQAAGIFLDTANGKKAIGLESMVLNSDISGLKIGDLDPSAKKPAPPPGTGPLIRLATPPKPAGEAVAAEAVAAEEPDKSAPGGSVDLTLTNFTAYGDDGQPIASLGEMSFGAKANIDKPHASLAVTYAHSALESEAIEELKTFLPHDASFGLSFERIPTEAAVTAFFALLMQAGTGVETAPQELAKQPSAVNMPDLFTGIRQSLHQAKTQLRAKAELKAAQAGLKLDGGLDADAEALYGVSGGFDIVINGLDEIKEWASSDPRHLPQAAMIALISDIAVSATTAEGERIAKYRIDITGDGKVSINGQDMAVVASLLKPLPGTEKLPAGEQKPAAAGGEKPAAGEQKKAASAGAPSEIALAVDFEGMQPALKDPLGPALEQLVERFVAAVKAKDLARLKDLLHPDFLTCVTEDNSKTFDAYLSETQFATAMTGGYRAVLRNFAATAPLPLPGLLSFPVRPTHSVTIDFEDPPRQPGATVIRLGPTVIRDVISDDGKWFLVIGCPTRKGFETMRSDVR